MFCPQCRVEYREGFTECSDCKVPLVAELPEETERQSPVDRVAVLIAEDPVLLDQALLLLREAGIECHLESGGSFVPDDDEVDLAAGPLSVCVSLNDESEAQNCLRELLERYSLSEEDFEGLQQAQDKQISSFQKDEPGMLVAAAEAGAGAAVEKLLEGDADVNQQNDAGQTALMAAADAGDDDMVRVLLEAGADVNVKDREGVRALHFAAHKGRTSIVEILLGKGACVNAQHDEGLTALMSASENGHLDCVRILLTNGADASLQDATGNSASTFAEYMGYTRIVRLLDLKTRLDKGLETDTVDSEGRNELQAAAAEGDAEMVTALIEVGADLRAADPQGRTALMWAALEGRTEVEEILLSRGAEVDAKDHDGGTALSWAADRGHIETVRVLLRHGADPNLSDIEGWTPVMWAEDKGYHDIAALLREASTEGRIS